MRILIDIGHPAHVHLLRNTFFELIKRKHFVIVTVKNLPVAKSLLEIYKISYIEIGAKKDSIIRKGINQIKYNWEIFKLVKQYNIDIGIGSSTSIAHVSKITRMKSILLDDDDDEVEPFFVKFAHPFADVILSPDVLIGKRKSNKTLYYSGYHELAYLHPNNFKPDANVLKDFGLNKDSIFFIMRFNAFMAHHDVGAQGLSIEQKLRLIKLLKSYGEVFITTERNIEPELKQFQLKISPEKAHSLMSFATMFLGDSQTMTSEAAVLGVPSLRTNSFVGRISYLEEEEFKYSLTYGFLPEKFEDMILKIEELLKLENLKTEWRNKKEKMLTEKIDVTKFFVWFLENYPKSKEIMKIQPKYSLNFK